MSLDRRTALDTALATLGELVLFGRVDSELPLDALLVVAKGGLGEARNVTDLIEGVRVRESLLSLDQIEALEDRIRSVAADAGVSLGLRRTELGLEVRTDSYSLGSTVPSALRELRLALSDADLASVVAVLVDPDWDPKVEDLDGPHSQN